MTPELNAPNNVVSQSKDTVTCCAKFLVPDKLWHRLDELYDASLPLVKQMLANRSKTSSKFYKGIPCVLAKSLIVKYQQNPKCKAVSKLILPVCGDKGRQIKTVSGGFQLVAFFKKEVIPVFFRLPVDGFLRYVEFYKREGRWMGSLCYSTPCAKLVTGKGTVGVDRNSVGNIAVMADPQSGHVRQMGFNPAKTKLGWRNRKRNLQRQGKRRLLSKLRKNHARRSTLQNHVVSKTVVNYAVKHSRVIVLEKLADVIAPGSKIRGYSLRSQWAFAQLATFIHYKARLAGVSVMEVDPAYTSQTCSRCGHIHKPKGKVFLCPNCCHQDHRDANAAFNIAKRGLELIALTPSAAKPLECIGGLATDSVRCRSGLIDSPGSGKQEATQI